VTHPHTKRFPALHCCILLSLLMVTASQAQNAPYDKAPDAEAPYYRVRYLASEKPGELIFPVQYTIWIPESVKTLRGIVVHQHGCGKGSCKSGQTGAFDLHWQALAKKHDCALLSPSYEQPQSANCQMWCDPRNGSAEAFFKGLKDLGRMSGHPELADLPLALWGHSGGGHWAGGMTLLYPEKVAAAWLRSGVPLLEANPNRNTIKVHELPEAALKVPIMCNPGTKEGVTVKDGRFNGVWPANETFFKAMRGKGALIGIAVDPLTSHECGNQRYMAIRWLDACLEARLPKRAGQPLKPMPTDKAWLAPILGNKAVAEKSFKGDKSLSLWLPNQDIAKAWEHYVRDTQIPDTTPPPAPSKVQLKNGVLTWEADADLESGIAYFIIHKDGKQVATVPEKPANRFGRPLFQGLQYSDTPNTPLVEMSYKTKGEKGNYDVVAVNTVGLRSN